MGKRTSASALAKLTKAEAKVALTARHACSAAARATHAARVAKATAAAATLAARVYVPTKARPYVAPVDISATRNVVRLARAASLQAVKAMRAIRMADAHIAAIKARAAKALATPAFVVPALVAEVHTVVEEGFSAWHRAFLAQVAMYVPVVTKALKGPTVGLSLERKVAYKAMRLVCRRAGSRDAIVPRTPRNSAEVRAAITARDNDRSVEKVTMHNEAEQQGISIATMLARKAQGSAQRAVNAMRVLARMVETKPSKVSPIKAYMVHTDTPILGKLVGTHALAAHHKSTHVVHATSGTKVADVRGEIKTSSTILAIRKANNIAARAAAWALKQERIAMRIAKVNRICTEVWYKQGVWVDTFLVRACNDSDHHTRVAAMTELLALRGVAA